MLDVLSLDDRSSWKDFGDVWSVQVVKQNSVMKNDEIRYQRDDDSAFSFLSFLSLFQIYRPRIIIHLPTSTRTVISPVKENATREY
jgi:hypothetical protein